MEAWESLCSPAKLYALFMTAAVFFDLYEGFNAYAIRHLVYGAIGTALLWVLCAANMSFAAWGLLAIPVLFYVFVFALWAFDQMRLVRVESEDARNGSASCSSSSSNDKKPMILAEIECKVPCGETNTCT